MSKIILFIQILFNEHHAWEFGICNQLLARRHKLNGNVQMMLWKAGERGHKEDYWHNFDPSWWSRFYTIDA